MSQKNWRHGEKKERILEQRIWDAMVAEVRRHNPCRRCPYFPYTRGLNDEYEDPGNDCAEGTCEVTAPSGEPPAA